MALSNTATPIYYGRFREAVMRGEIPVCREIAMEMERIDDLIANPGIYYDDKAVNGFISFCEDELTLTDGTDVKLLDSFKLWAEEIFGWYYFVERSVFVPNERGGGGHYETRRLKKRLVTKQYLIITRSAAKTMYLEFLQAYFLTAYTTTTQQLTTAPTMKQAEEVLAPFRTALARAKGPVFQFMTEGSLQNTTGSKADRVKMASTKKGIENFLTNSLLEVRPMTIEKLQGRRDTVATVDEWLSCDIREDPIGAIEQGAAKNENYLIVAASSEGTVRNGCGDDIKMELMSILKGEYVNPHVSIWYYKLDSIEEVGQPEMWLKANPNLGKTVSYETYQLDVERAEKSPQRPKRYSGQALQPAYGGLHLFLPLRGDPVSQEEKLLADALCHGRGPFHGRRLLRLYLPVSAVQRIFWGQDEGLHHILHPQPASGFETAAV